MGYGDTYVSGVTNTLLRQGDAAANARLRRGDIAAQTLGQLGQIAAQVPGQIQQAQQEQRAKAELQEAATLANQFKLSDGQPDWVKVADTLEAKSPMSPVAKEIRTRAQAQQKSSLDMRNVNSEIATREGNLGVAQTNASTTAGKLAAEQAEAKAKAERETAMKAILTKHVDPDKGVIVDWSPAIADLASAGFTEEAKKFADLVKAQQPEKVTFGAPTPAMLAGQRVFVRTGSDGKTYDMTGKVVAETPKPIAPEGAAPSFTRAEIVLPDGTIKTANYNSRTGKYTDVDTGAVLQGVGRAPTDKDISAAEGKKKLGGIVTALSGLSEKINTQNGVIATLKGKEEKAKAAINLNDDVAEYQSIIESFTPIIARALGHTGVLTQQDVDSAKAMFPKPEDSKSLRDRKVKRLNELLGLTPAAAAGPKKETADPLGIRGGGDE